MFKIATQKHENDLRTGDARDWGFLEPPGARADIAVPGIGGARTYPTFYISESTGGLGRKSVKLNVGVRAWQNSQNALQPH